MAIENRVQWYTPASPVQETGFFTDPIDPSVKLAGNPFYYEKPVQKKAEPENTPTLTELNEGHE